MKLELLLPQIAQRRSQSKKDVFNYFCTLALILRNTFVNQLMNDWQIQLFHCFGLSMSNWVWWKFVDFTQIIPYFCGNNCFLTGILTSKESFSGNFNQTQRIHFSYSLWCWIFLFFQLKINHLHTSKNWNRKVFTFYFSFITASTDEFNAIFLN